MPTVLTGDSTISAGTTGGTITFSSTINGAQALILTPGSAGAVVLQAIVGGTTPIGVFNVTNGTSLTVSADVHCSSGTWSAPLTIPTTPTVTTQ
jgi:hypothetical protein